MPPSFLDLLVELLPELPKSPSPTIVDIGCGLALYHLKISCLYSGRSQHYLADRDANELRHKRRAVDVRGGQHDVRQQERGARSIAQEPGGWLVARTHTDEFERANMQV